MTARRRRQPRGFTIILAIVLMALTASAAALLMRQLDYEYQRTQSTEEDAQLRQLLLAGAQDAADHARTWDNDPAPANRWPVPLPQGMTDQDMSLSIEWAETGPDVRKVRVDARYDKRSASESLRYERADGRWHFARVEDGQ